jgi:hypothetical protein
MEKIMDPYYDVEVLRQEQNPICWVASCAMVKGYAQGASLGIGDLTDGFDPYNSCIANLANSWSGCTDMMESWGFAVYPASSFSSGSVDDTSLSEFMAQNGPVVLLHLCDGFPYGDQYPAGTAAGGAHAVVLTGIDLDNRQISFNNPWGDKDQIADLDTMISKINSDSVMGKTMGVFAMSL